MQKICICWKSFAVNFFIFVRLLPCWVPTTMGRRQFRCARLQLGTKWKLTFEYCSAERDAKSIFCLYQNAIRNARESIAIVFLLAISLTVMFATICIFKFALRDKAVYEELVDYLGWFLDKRTDGWTGHSAGRLFVDQCPPTRSCTFSRFENWALLFFLKTRRSASAKLTTIRCSDCTS